MKTEKNLVRIFLSVLLIGFVLPACGKMISEEGGDPAPLDPNADWSPSSDWAAKGTREGDNNNPYEDGTYYDAVADMAGEMYYYDPPPDLPPDLPPPDVDEEEDVDEEDEVEEEELEEDVFDDERDDAGDDNPDASGGGGGEDDLDEPYVLYLSADDSNSQASPIVARWIIGEGRIVPWSVVRVHEFLNYYDINYPAAPDGEVSVSSQFRAIDFDGGLYALQIAVASEEMDPAGRMPMNITFVLDTSGSMSGTPIELERDVVRAIASQLKEGDIVSAVEWDTSRAIRLDSYNVTGPDDPVIVNMAAALESGGGTDLHAGLEMGYALAARNYTSGLLNRVVLISDGQANVGITDIGIIAAAADDSEGEGIYLVGVGCGNGYNDTLMDEVTDAGKGAYIFIDSPAEAAKMFSDRFLQSMQIAARDVEVELTLPGVFRMEIFYGEEYSTVAEEVDPQHLAPDDAMVFHQLLRAVDPEKVFAGDVISVRVTYTLSTGGPRRLTATTSSTLQKLIHAASSQMRKADAIVIFAQALMRISTLVEDGDGDMAVDVCESAIEVIRESAIAIDDDELFEIVDLLESYIPIVATGH